MNIALYILVGVLLLLVTVFFVYSFIKDRITRKRTQQEIKRIEKEATIFAYENCAKIDALIQNNSKQMENFVPSVGEYKMSDLVKASDSYLNKILNSIEYRSYIDESEQYLDFKKNLLMLKETNSNLWTKKLPFVLEWFNKNVQNYKQQLEKINETDVIEIKDQQELAMEVENEYQKLLKQS
ncbi:hypothetical protein GE118_01820 [Mycoplasma sp. NEAQ87857]|uniref:MHJ_0274 family protein n=1 Tax=Mycoplasma sp. NEAQ87857 TaxID=2683967 RepID=UPI0013160CBE|nr:hypothetical protein [Mycoplasma sp. NEAQ87857]QGZ97533.1 hypothetical protein GE118_01820 [Mycoplasma sp. NEAQ87857]